MQGNTRTTPEAPTMKNESATPIEMKSMIQFELPVTFKDNRTLLTVITDQHRNPWWVAKEVCTVLGIATRDVSDRLDEDEKSYVGRTHLGLNPGRDMLIVNEPGLYALIGKSRKPEAKAFKRWVNHEVLPEIRKTGSYSAQPAMTDGEKLLALAQGVIELTTWKKEARPKIEYYDRFVDPKGALPLPTIAEQLSWDPDEFIEQLRKDKFIYSHDGTDIPFQRYIENGVLRLFLDDGDGHGDLNGETRATVKGALILACEYGTAAERAEAKQQLKQLRRQQRLREAEAVGIKPKLRLITTPA
jgi:anti-repressor protein